MRILLLATDLFRYIVPKKEFGVKPCPGLAVRIFSALPMKGKLSIRCNFASIHNKTALFLNGSYILFMRLCRYGRGVWLWTVYWIRNLSIHQGKVNLII